MAQFLSNLPEPRLPQYISQSQQCIRWKCPCRSTCSPLSSDEEEKITLIQTFMAICFHFMRNTSWILTSKWWKCFSNSSVCKSWNLSSMTMSSMAPTIWSKAVSTWYVIQQVKISGKFFPSNWLLESCLYLVVQDHFLLIFTTQEMELCHLKLVQMIWAIDI